MTKLDALEEYAKSIDVHIYDFHFSETKRASCVRCGSYSAVTIDRAAIETRSEERILLAEELGHYETGSLYVLDAMHNTPNAKINSSKQEAKARHWAYEICLPPSSIKRAMQFCDDEYALAEYCDVTVEFLCKALEYYLTKGIEFTYNDYSGA